VQEKEKGISRTYPIPVRVYKRFIAHIKKYGVKKAWVIARALDAYLTQAEKEGRP